MTDRRMRLRLHAALRDAAAVELIELSIPAEATPRDAFDAAIAQAPGLMPWRDVVAFGTDQRLLAPNEPIPPALTTMHALPPVSGG
jgi:hypothetical protein